MSYGGLNTFFGGLESLIGAPNPSITEAMRREHCEAPDSRLIFTTGNYKLSTTSEVEWLFVVRRGERTQSWGIRTPRPAAVRWPRRRAG